MRGDSSVFCRTQMIRSAEGDECLVHLCACQLPGCFSVVAVPRTRSLCHLSLSGCLKPRLNVGYFRGFLHKSDASDKKISWGFHCSHHSTFVDWDFIFMNCVWTLCLMHVLCPSPLPPSPVGSACYCCLFILNMQISVLSKSQFSCNKLSLICVSALGFIFKGHTKAMSRSNAVNLASSLRELGQFKVY